MKPVKCSFTKDVYDPVLYGRDTSMHQHKCQYMKFHARKSGSFHFSNMVSNPAYTDWNINVQKDESSKINELQNTVTNKIIQMDI